MRKIKCDVCSTLYQGFHLCNTPEVKAMKPGKTYVRTESHKQRSREAQYGRWEREWEQNRERDEKILEMYESGISAKKVGNSFGLTNHQVTRIVRRLGGIVRPPGGVNQHNTLT